jgi:soluble lytic murein transglycosylase-like protein
MEKAAELQRQAIRKQAESLGLWMVPGSRVHVEPSAEPVAAAEATCDKLSDADASALIESAARAQSLDPRLLRALIEQESGYQPCAVSSKGAKGLMQLMPDTASQFGVEDPFDPDANVAAGAKFLKQLLDKYGGDRSLALAAYNSGPATVDQVGGIPKIRETQDYVAAILKKLAGSGIPPP